MSSFLNKVIKTVLGDKSEKDIKAINPIIQQIHGEFDKLQSLSHDELRAKTAEFKKQIQDTIAPEKENIASKKEEIASNEDMDPMQKESIYDEIDKLEEVIVSKTEDKLNDLLPQAFAVVKETAKRFKENENIEVSATDYDKELALTYDFLSISGEKAIYKNSWTAGGGEVAWDMVHYDVQLIGGVVMHQGKIAEMATGEGKTLVATLPVYLNALSGNGVHLVTVNDYLARRDSEWMGPLFQFHGLSIDCVDKHEPKSESRIQAYRADITYGTNNEFGFDYLRDNMSSDPEELVQRKPNFAIVDEVDSVLIDEARTPLIISGPTPKGDQHEFEALKPKVETLMAAQRKLATGLLAQAKKLLNNEEASKKDREEGGLALLRVYRGMPKNKALIKFLSEPGIRNTLTKTENFYLQDQGKEMAKVDAELFFVIDEKHNSVELTEKGIELISGENQDPDFFIMPDIGMEMAAIDKKDMAEDKKRKEKDKLFNDYAVKSERVHTINQLLKAYAMFEKDVDYVTMDNKVKIVDEQTGRIMDGRRYSDGLHQAIEAKESVKIEAATQTYATVTLQNYFRMYNKLSGMTGTAETEAGEFWEIYKLDVVVIPTNRPIARDDRDDLVFKTAREKYNAVIDETEKLVQQKRPVLVGTTSVEISELLSRMLKRKNIKHQVLNAKLHQKEAEVVAEAGKPGTVTIATNMAGRGTDIKLGKGVREAGGLAILGTERHESRRVDRQLRGRAGRQGDPGSSQFFVSLEDNLMRLFGSERISKLMDRMGHKEGEVIQHGMISKSIERAQKKVEENNFGVRKRLLEYDDVMNSQREVVYKKRKHALYGERLSVDISNSIFEICQAIVEEHQEFKDFEGLELESFRNLGVELPFDEAKFTKQPASALAQELYEKAYENYTKKSVTIAKTVFPVVKRVYENESDKYRNMVIPFTDGIKSLQIVSNLEKSSNSEGKEVVKSLEKGVTLAMIDNSWKEHLREMDDLRQSVQFATHEQKDPLLIYKFESFNLFKAMLDKTNREIVSFLLKADLPSQEQPTVAQQPQKKAEQKTIESRGNIEGGQQDYNDPSAPKKQEPVTVEKTFNRNDKVEIQNLTTRESKVLKYKQAVPLIDGGQWVLVGAAGA